MPTLAVILAGGRGTRLRCLVAGPKVLVPFAGRPFLDHLLSDLAAQGIREVLLLTGFGHRRVRAFAGNGRKWGLRLRYAVERGRLLGTGGAVRRALPRIGSRTFFLLNGDSFFRASLPRLAAFHRERRAAVTLAVVRVPDVSRYGSIRLGREGRIAEFLEKGRKGPGWVSMGLYAVDRAAVAKLPAGRPASIERDLFPKLAGRGLFAWAAPSAHLDFGTPRSLREARRRYGLK